MPTDKQRREAERRRLQRQVQRRAERAAARRRLSIILSVIGAVIVVAVVLVFVIGTGNDDSSKKQAAPTCTWTKSGTASKTAHVPDTTNPPKTGTTAVSLQTSRGTLSLSLDRATAPCAVESFVSLAQQKYFDSTPCHRITSSGGLYVLQCGDPTGSGSGGPGYSFADELTGKEKYTQGVLAMANSGADTNGSQFFIVYKNSSLPAKYTVFGHVTKGLDVVQQVAAKGSTPTGDGKPKLPISITKATVG